MNQYPPIKIGLKPLFTRINLPTVIRTAILPGDRNESLSVATQLGEIFVMKDGISRLFLDITNRIIQLREYDERGLLGLAFHPKFNKNGLFYLHYSMKDTQGPGADVKGFKPNPCDLKSVTWANRDRMYDHIDTVEEWIIKEEKIVKSRTLLKLVRPFMNHNGIHSLNFSPENGRLILITGDGGDAYDPFNLSQQDDEIAGKIIEIDVDQSQSNHFQAVSRFSELPLSVKQSLRVIGKGVRNGVGITFYKKDRSYMKFVGNVGQDLVESVFAFKSEKGFFKRNLSQMVNLGWRAWEGILPTISFEQCQSITMSNKKIIVYYNELVELSTKRINAIINYFHEETRKGKIAGTSLTGVQVYLGKTIPQLTESLIFSDWLTDGGKVGMLAYTKVNENQLEKVHDFGIINIDYPFESDRTYFVSLGTNQQQTRLFLGTYGAAGTADRNKGTVFEIVPVS